MMKKRYSTPKLDLVFFETDERVMWNESGGEVSFPGFGEKGFETPTMGPNGTVVNNNGAPTFVPGGNGGGGRQTPLG